MTEEGSWPEFPGYDPTIATTSRVMWRSPRRLPAAGFWDEPGRYGTIPEWQPAKASGWFLFPWLRNLKQWTLDMEANARPLLVPWSNSWREAGGTQEDKDNGAVVLLSGGRWLEIQGARPSTCRMCGSSTSVEARPRWGIGCVMASGSSPRRRGSSYRGRKARCRNATAPSAPSTSPGSSLTSRPGSSDSMSRRHDRPRPRRRSPARLGGASPRRPAVPEPPGDAPAGRHPNMIPCYTGFALDITDAGIEQWLAHLAATGRRKSIRYEEARRQFARNLRGWQTDADAPKPGAKRPTQRPPRRNRHRIEDAREQGHPRARHRRGVREV